MSCKYFSQSSVFAFVQSIFNHVENFHTWGQVYQSFLLITSGVESPQQFILFKKNYPMFSCSTFSLKMKMTKKKKKKNENDFVCSSLFKQYRKIKLIQNPTPREKNFYHFKYTSFQTSLCAHFLSSAFFGFNLLLYRFFF